MFLELLMYLIMIALNGCLFNGAIHTLDLSIRPG
jgi:hypothetical protein